MAGSMNRFEVIISKTYYIHQRYGVHATFALLYHESPLEVSDLGSFIRLSDHIIPIDGQHDFIIFTFTTEENAYKASQNLLRKLDDHFGSADSCIALDTFDTNKTPHTVLNRLKQILAEARKHTFSRIENESALDGCF